MLLLSQYNKFRFILTKSMLRQVDWKIFLFLVLFLNVKLWIKILALIIMYTMRLNFRFGFRWKSSRLPPFYLAVMLITMINWIGYGGYSHAQYGLVLITGLLFWAFCILAIHQITLSVEHSSTTVLHNTLLLFFILNMIVSLSNMLTIILETGTWNPYQYQGLFQKYFIGTGDYIKGLSFDTSTTNALINAFGVVYFLSRKLILCTVCCMITLLLAGSNLANILLVSVFIFSFIFQSDRDQKSLIVVCLLLLIIFLGRVSPQNDHYFFSATKTMLNIPDDKMLADLSPAKENFGSFSTEQKKTLIAAAYLDSAKSSWAILNKSKDLPNYSWVRPVIPQPNINRKEYQRLLDTTTLQRELMHFVETHYNDTNLFIKKMDVLKLPGKIIAMRETIEFLKNHPSRIITGNGLGNFSSKLAFRVTGLNIAGKYPAGHAYINPYFMENQLRLYLYYFIRQKDAHSIIHTPDSVINQLSGEYGLAGIFCFLFFYLGWFTIKVKKTSYSASLLMLMTGAFFSGYWFEQLSLVPFFELLMLMEMKLNKNIISDKK